MLYKIINLYSKFYKNNKGKIMEINKKLLCITGASLLLSSTHLFGEEKSARDILNNSYQYIGSMDKYAFDAVVVDNQIAKDGTKGIYRQNVSVKVDRPGNIRVETKGDIKNRTNTLNNGLFTMIDNEFGYYGQIKTPKTLDATLDFLFDKYGIKAPLAQFVYSDMHKRVKFKKSKNFGTVVVDGTECDYVAFSDSLREIHMWITTGDEPLVKVFSIIDKSAETDLRINASLSWRNNPKILDSDFIFSVPKDSMKISVQNSN